MTKETRQNRIDEYEAKLDAIYAENSGDLDTDEAIGYLNLAYKDILGGKFNVIQEI